jgi:flagellar protein FlbD
MITITKINDKEIVINSDLIETMESTPDTTISMTTGRKIIVKEEVEKVIDKVVEYKKRILTQY